MIHCQSRSSWTHYPRPAHTVVQNWALISERLSAETRCRLLLGKSSHVHQGSTRMSFNLSQDINLTVSRPLFPSSFFHVAQFLPSNGYSQSMVYDMRLMVCNRFYRAHGESTFCPPVFFILMFRVQTPDHQSYYKARTGLQYQRLPEIHETPYPSQLHLIPLQEPWSVQQSYPSFFLFLALPITRTGPFLHNSFTTQRISLLPSYIRRNLTFKSPP